MDYDMLKNGLNCQPTFGLDTCRLYLDYIVINLALENLKLIFIYLNIIYLFIY